MTMASRFTGRIHENMSQVKSYFRLKATNDSLVKRLAEMHNNRPENYLTPDTTNREVADYIPLDTLGNTKKILRFIYRPATVIYKSENDDKKNYILLARGKNDGIAVDMAVISAESNAVAGKVVYADAKYAVVMSLLHKRSVVPAKLKKTGESGTITWDGRQPNYLVMNRVPKTAQFAKGDTVVTSINSTVFPPGLNIGTIESFSEEKATGNYTIKLRTSVDFYNLRHVLVIENLQQKEMSAALKAVEKQIDKNP
ncbi:MAG: rod shape-determining protein MreC [Dinghuibacter sp.]|nr:rod shape-determining protein MreC [Dinghuibacter sp.]